jgi:hypothetical protein
MTRNARATVRRPGASTAPATSTRTRLQIGAVKHGRNTASHVARIAGAGSRAAVDSGVFNVIAGVESRRPDRAGVRRATGEIRQAIATSLCGCVYHHRDGRPDYSPHRSLPLRQGALVRRTAQPRLHDMRGQFRRLGRAAAPNQKQGPLRSSLLVALEGPMRPQALRDTPSCQSMMPSALSPAKISFGWQHDCPDQNAESRAQTIAL